MRTCVKPCALVHAHTRHINRGHMPACLWPTPWMNIEREIHHTYTHTSNLASENSKQPLTAFLSTGTTKGSNFRHWRILCTSATDMLTNSPMVARYSGRVGCCFKVSRSGTLEYLVESRGQTAMTFRRLNVWLPLTGVRKQLSEFMNASHLSGHTCSDSGSHQGHEKVQAYQIRQAIFTCHQTLGDSRLIRTAGSSCQTSTTTRRSTSYMLWHNRNSFWPWTSRTPDAKLNRASILSTLTLHLLLEIDESAFSIQ